MPNEIDTKRLATYNASNQPIKDLYGSLELGEILIVFNEKNDFDDSTQQLIIDTIGDTILGFYPKADLAINLVKYAHLESTTANSLSNELLSGLLTIVPGPAPLPKASNDLKERLDLRPQSQPAPEGVANPLTREEIIESLSLKRTMASDIEAAKSKAGDQAGSVVQKIQGGLRWESEKE